MTTTNNAASNVRFMMEHDRFSQWMGLDVTVHEPGSVTARMKVREEMLNGFKVCHGGIMFSLADSVLAFAANASEHKAVSIEASIAYPNPVYEGDVVTATSHEISRSDKLGIYSVSLVKENGTVVADFRGVVYYTQTVFPRR